MELTQEQIENMIEAFNRICDILKEVFEKVKEAFLNFINSFNSEKIIKIYKYDKIYCRTHNKRIKKKQLKKIRELLM